MLASGGMLFAASVLATAVAASTIAVPTPVTLPSGTHLRFHLVRPLASDRSKAGQSFSFVLLGPVAVGGRVVVADGAVGTGTVILAGPAGASGHEGDLTLRLDQVPAVNGAAVAFCQQLLHINGRRKTGVFSVFARGSESRISTKTPIETVLTQPTAGAPNSCAG